MIVFMFFVVSAGVILAPRTTAMKGKMHAGPDPKSAMWAMWWVQHEVIRDPLNLYRANIYYPEDNALAYSDSYLAPALLALPFRLVTQEMTVIVNIALWTTFALSGFCMYLLVLRLTRNQFIGIAAGFVFAFSPFRLDIVSHISTASHQWLPLLLLSLLLFFVEKQRRYAFLAAAFTWLVAMSYSAHLLMAALLMGVFVGLLHLAMPLTIKRLGVLCLAGLVFLIALFPFYYPIYDVAQSTGIEADPNEILIFSADVLDYGKQPKYLISAPYSILPEVVKNPYFSLFPGFLASAAIVAALALFFLGDGARLSGKGRSALSWSKHILFGLTVILAGLLLYYAVTGPRATAVTSFNVSTLLVVAVFLAGFVHVGLTALAHRQGAVSLNAFLLKTFVLLALLSAFMTLGPVLHVNNAQIGMNIYWFVGSFVPGFEMFRVILHWHAFTMLFAVPAAALATVRLLALPRLARFTAAGLVSVALLFEYQTDMSRDYVEVPLQVPEMYAWLAGEPDASPVLGLPMFEYPYHPEADRMYWSMYHGKPIVNGQFSYVPESHEALIENVRDFPSANSLRYIQDHLMVKYLAVRLSHYDSARLAHLEELVAEEWSAYRIKDKWPYFWVLENTEWRDEYFYAPTATNETDRASDGRAATGR